MYIKDSNIPIIFDSGCAISVTLNKRYFDGNMTVVNKSMVGLGASARVEGGEIIE